MSEYAPKHNSGKISAEDKKKRTLIVVLVIVVAALIAAAVLFIGGVFSPSRGTGSLAAYYGDPADNSAYISAFKGTWKIDSITSYEFDGAGKGTMHTAVDDYSFAYAANAERVKFDFDDPKAADHEYEYSLSGSNLTLRRQGVTYPMTKVE